MNKTFAEAPDLPREPYEPTLAMVAEAVRWSWLHMAEPITPEQAEGILIAAMGAR
jgi:hypothetical protein